MTTGLDDKTRFPIWGFASILLVGLFLVLGIWKALEIIF